MVKIIGGLLTFKALKKAGILGAISLSAYGGYSLIRSTFTTREAEALSGGTTEGGIEALGGINPTLLIVIFGAIVVLMMINNRS